MFRDSDKLIEGETYDGEVHHSFLGFKTTVTSVRNRLRLSGLTRRTLVEIYHEYRDSLKDSLYQSLEYKIVWDDERLDTATVERELKELWASLKFPSPEEEIEQFLTVLRDFLGRQSQGSDMGPETFHVSELEKGVFDERALEEPWIPWLFEFYIGESDHKENQDLSFIIQLLITLEALGEEAEVSFDLTEMLDNVEDLDTILADCYASLLQRVGIYRRLFFGLLQAEKDRPNQHLRSYCRELLGACDTTENKFEKGRALENFIEALFTASGNFAVQAKNLNVGDEEIDIVLRNQTDLPFWNALGTPCVFLECKNWKAPVGSKELRDFAMKVENHRTICRLGIIVGLNGFTKEVDVARARLSRTDSHLVLLTREDIVQFLDSDLTFIDWVTSLVSRL